MQWLAQNWIWLVLAAGALWFFSRGHRGGMMGGCGAHGMTHDGPAGKGASAANDAPAPPADGSAQQGAGGGASAPGRRRSGCC